MDEDQQARFKRAVERKAQASEEASRAPQQHPPGPDAGVAGDQENLRSPAQPQDTFSVREKSTRHRKVTADKWNQ